MQKQMLVFLLIVSIFFGLQAQHRGDLVFDSLLHVYDRAEVAAVYDEFNVSELLFPIDFGVELYKVIYRMPAATGDSLTLASGLVAVPISDKFNFPLLAYNHGSLPYDSIVSELNSRFGQHLFGIPFAANGYVTALPDYLGYGATPPDHPHPYLHARTEATAVVDMLRATRKLCMKLATGLNGQVFLLGYSQGGHVTMAAHRELETFHPDEFTVTAAAPCSGPYDLSGISRDSLLFNDRFAYPLFITFTALSYQYVYGNMYEQLEDMFVDPYPDLIRRIFDRRHPETKLLDDLPYPALEMFDPLFYEDLITNDDHPFNVALRDNDVYDWAPRAPVRMFYCLGDEKVPYQNALFTEGHMTGLGASNVSSAMVGLEEDHEECTYPALIFAKLWFDTYRTINSPTRELAALKNQVFLYPNPFRETVVIGGSTNYRPDRIVVYDLLGQKIFSKELHQTNSISVPQGQLTKGSYVFELQGKGWFYRQILLRL